MKEKYIAFALITLIIIPSAIAVTLMHTTKTQFVLQYGSNPNCVIVDSNGNYISNQTITILGISPVANTTDTIVLGVKNVAPNPINITSINANTTDTNIKLTIQTPHSVQPFFTVASGTTFPFNVIATVINIPTTTMSQPINVFVSCN